MTGQPFRADMLMELVQLLRDEHPTKSIPKNDHFDMHTYLSFYGKNAGPTLCGTHACAMGWATMLLPKFKNRYQFLGQCLYARDINGNERITPDHNAPLGITHPEYAHLFLPGDWEYHGKFSRRGVAREIEKFVKRKIKECAKTGQKVKMPAEGVMA